MGAATDSGYQVGDIFLVSGHGFFSRAIRRFTRSKDEAKTLATHVGVVVSGGSPQDSVVVEALSQGVIRRPFMQGPGRESHAVYRPLNLSSAAIAAGVAVAHGCVGKQYGWGKIVAQALDFALPWRDPKGQPLFAFRRLAGVKNMPICSYLVDEVVAEELVYDARRKILSPAGVFSITVTPFGVPRNTVTPDDIMDFAEGHPDFYACVRVMGPP